MTDAPASAATSAGAQRAPELGRVGGEPLERRGQHRLAERAQLRRELVHQRARTPARVAFSAWIFLCAPVRRASGSFAPAPRSSSACT